MPTEEGNGGRADRRLEGVRKQRRVANDCGDASGGRQLKKKLNLVLGRGGRGRRRRDGVGGGFGETSAGVAAATGARRGIRTAARSRAHAERAGQRDQQAHYDGGGLLHERTVT